MRQAKLAMTIHSIPVLVCKNPKCRERIALPYKILQGSATVEWYWPEDNRNVVLVCHHCGQTHSYLEREVQSLPAPESDPQAPPTVMWRATYECIQPRCGFPIVVHVRGPERLSIGGLNELTQDATGKVACERGHLLDGRAHLDRADLVEWDGPEGYLS